MGQCEIDGLNDGSLLGAALMEGESVGFSVGSLDGLDVGEVVGLWVGLIGDAVGN